MKLNYIAITATSFLLLSMQYVYASFIDPPVHSDQWTDKYDRHFKKYSKRYFGPFFDWQWFKAQAIAESGLNDEAESHVGAKGIMQIMPATMDELSEKNPHLAKVDDPHWNIAAGIFYDRTLYRKIKNAPEQDRLYMTFASYNAGYGRILSASRRIGDKEKNWNEVKKYLPKETRGYVRRIRELMGEND